jgi:GT2 family glycosyltransferase
MKSTDKSPQIDKNRPISASHYDSGISSGPAASIIVPLLRQRDDWLRQCVESAVNQSTRCEVIVVRSTATPPSNVSLLSAMEQEWGNLRVLIENRPGSFPGAINLGISLAATDRIGLLLSDDWLDPNCVATCLRRSADIVCTGHTVYFEDGITVNEAASQTLFNTVFSSLTTLEARASYLEHFFLFSKAALLAAGGLDESMGNFPGIDDYDLIWTLLEQGVTVEIVEQRFYNYRDHDGERLTRADPEQAVRNLEKILRKHRLDPSEMRKIVECHRRWFGKAIYRVLTAYKAE